jgi:glutathione peroxidase
MNLSLSASGLGRLLVCVGVIGVNVLAVSPALARPEYAAREKQKCLYCHERPGQARNFRGLYYATHGKSFEDFDNVFEAKAAGVAPEAVGPEAMPKKAGYPKGVTVPPALNFILKDIEGKPINLGRYQGSVALVVNVASFCGNTPQYKSLQALYNKYQEKGLVVLGFPANEFGKQEPGSNEEIKDFCTTKYNVTFPMFSKIVVKGNEQHPFYKYLTDKQTDPKFGGDIEWNFAKFIINRKGEIVARIPAMKDPMKADVVAAIEKELAKGQ